MPTISYVNPFSELASSQEGVAQAQQDNTFAEQMVQLAVLGYGDPYAARQVLAVARAQMGNQLQKEEFWFNVIKDEKESIKKAWELIKD
ncbi:MAG: hypothetical protein HYR97_04540 [Candidatus Melainabacteria bacterium]|nr:hypothetical protein [Candidatus Melainabacteria bacterium]MBI3308534.1 hypothetical protein [Candidatus Melainabacteria bacterium]